jgi:hypothetical protein
MANRKTKPTKLASLKQIDGKAAPESQEEFVAQKTTLDQIWGDDGTSKYGTMEESEYAARLEDMNLSDMQRHAVEVAGLPATDNKGLLIKRLLAEFRAHVGSYRKPAPSKSTVNLSKKAASVLAEGR